jgi:hypothetical protein
MISKKDEHILGITLANEKMAAEIVTRVIDTMPQVAVTAQFEGQVAGMATDVIINADNAGSVGNITLEADEIKNIDELITDWNIANPENAVTISSGDGSQIPTEDIELSGGVNANTQEVLAVISDSEQERKQIEEYLIVACASRKAGKEIAEQLNLIVDCLKFQDAADPANNAALAAAQAKISAFSKETREIFIVACANRSVAKNILDAIESAGQIAAAIAAA